MRPFRFAVGAAEASSAEDWREKARRAEALGYDVFLMPDHFGRQLAPGPALAAVAEATTRIRIGSFVYANDFRHPLLLAKEVATLDVLSGGRMEFGLGAGWRVGDYEQLGIAYDPPPIRVERMLESLRLIKRLFAEEEVDFEGRHYRARRARLAPRPVQRPRPPLMVGGGGPRMLRIAAREAEIVGLLPQVDAKGRHQIGDLGARATAAKVERVRAAAGARFDALELNVLIIDAEVAPDRVFALETLAARVKGAVASLVDSPYFLYGTLDEIRRDLLARRERLGISYYAIPDRGMEALAPLVRELKGR